MCCWDKHHIFHFQNRCPSKQAQGHNLWMHCMWLPQGKARTKQNMAYHWGRQDILTGWLWHAHRRPLDSQTPHQQCHLHTRSSIYDNRYQKFLPQHPPQEIWISQAQTKWYSWRCPSWVKFTSKSNTWQVSVCGNMERDVWITTNRAINTRAARKMTVSTWIHPRQTHTWFVKHHTEVEVHESCNHWMMVHWSNMQTGDKTIRAVWSFKCKWCTDGKLNKYKARLCAHGCIVNQVKTIRNLLSSC